MCLYCYATSYIGRRRSTPKRDLLRRVERDIRQILRQESRPLVNMSTSSDPYPPEDVELKLTRRVLELLSRYPVDILVTTKSSLVVRDMDILLKTRSAVMITITTLDDNLAHVIEPGAPPPSERIRAVERLAQEGIPVGVRIDPVIPFINDDPAMLKELVKTVVSAGAKHVVTSSYKAKPDNFRRLVERFPELEQRLRKLYYEEGEYIHGYRYLRSDYRKRLLQPVIKACAELGVTYATCREGIPGMRSAPSCDGSHLINMRARA